jgi:preprotein translocase subunit YajC
MLNTIQDQVARMSAEELNLVVESIKLRRTFLARQTTNSLVIGDKVQFDGGRKYGVVTGVVTKVNLKTIKVDSGGTVWKVSANLITKVSELEYLFPAPVPNKV